MADKAVSAVGPQIGVLSFAHYHANFWSEVFAAQGLLAGIWDDDAGRGREAAARFGTTYSADLDVLLTQCTAVAICSETSRHTELIERAASRGLAILVEKPLATSAAEGERIAEIVRAHGTVFMQSFPKRFDPVSHYLKKIVDEQTLGRLALARVRHGHFYGLTPGFAQRWYVQPALAGGGALLDEGIHGADLLAWLFGMPSGVTAVISHAALGLQVEDLGIATFGWRSGLHSGLHSGLLAELTASFCFAAADVSIELYGSLGTVLVSAVDLASRDITREAFVRIHRRAPGHVAGSVSPAAAPAALAAAAPAWETVPITPRFKLGQFHQQNALVFIDCLVRGTAPPVSLDDGLRALRMIDSAYRAARTGCRQEIHE